MSSPPRFSRLRRLGKGRRRWLLPVLLAALAFLLRGCSAPAELRLSEVMARYGLDYDLVRDYRCTLGAHRGASREYRENTLAALLAAQRQRRYAFIEFDVQYSRDRKIMVHHDLRLLRQFGSFRAVGETTAEKLLELSEGEIALYQDVIPRLKKRLNIEIKSQGDAAEDRQLADELIADLKQRGRLDEVLISSISAELIGSIKQRYPEVATGKIFWLTSSTYLPFDALTRSLYAEIAESRADYILLHVANLHNIEDLLQFKPAGKTLAFWDFADNIYLLHADAGDRLWGRGPLAAFLHRLRFRLLSPLPWW